MGLMNWWKKLRQSRRQVLVEDALKHLHACEWRGRSATTESLAGALGRKPRSIVRLCQWMQGQGWLRSTAGGLRLTGDGERLALEVIRAHRLWERYLADEARMPLARVHAVADRREHARSAEVIEALDAAMGHPTLDPHGDPIPTAEGKMPRPDMQPLTEWPVGETASIVHLEDQPPAVFSQIAAEGLRPGMQIRVIESDEQRVVFADERETYVLAPLVAANIHVVPAEPFAVMEPLVRLSSLEAGDAAVVHKLDDSLQGYTRRRMLDLGLTPGAEVRAEYAAFLGDPMAYRVRGSLIALRREQADQVYIRTNGVMENSHG